MKCRIDSPFFSTAANLICEVVERHNTIPILGTILVETVDGGCRLTGTDLDNELSIILPATVERSGAVCVSADVLRRIGEHRGGPLEITADDRAIICDGNSARYSLNTWAVTDFPHLKKSTSDTELRLPAPVLLNIITTLRPAISREETRYYLNGIVLDTRDGELCFAATDGHRLAQRRLPKANGEIRQSIVARKTIKALAKAFELWDQTIGDVLIELSPAAVAFSWPGFLLRAKLIDGTYPDYRRVIPIDLKDRAIFDPHMLASRLARIMTISRPDRAVLVKLAADGCELSADNPDIGTASCPFPCDFAGADVKVGMNARFLADILAHCTAPTTLRVADAASPVKFECGDDRVFVLMPMRV